MKRCPECRRDYFDDSLMYCLDDGSPLLEGPSSDGAPTAILAHESDADEKTRQLPVATAPKKGSGFSWPLGLAIGAAVLVAAGLVYWFGFRDSPPVFVGSFRDLNSPAYDHYLRGKLDSNSQNRERNQNAIRILEQVIAADPGLAPAYAAVARAYAIKADLFVVTDQKKLYDDARLAAEKALAIDPSLAEAHLSRGAAIWNHVNRFPHEQTIQAYKKAIALDPNIEEAHHLLGLVYYHIGLFDKSEQELQKAVELDPTNSLARFRIGQVKALRTDYEGALAIFKTVPSEANAMVIDRATAGVLFQLGRTNEAWKVVNDFLANNSDEGGNVTSVKAMLLAKEGRSAEAEDAIRRSIEIGRNFQHFHHASYNIASAYAMLGNRDEALKWLRFTADEGFPCYPLFEKDKSFDALRQDENFKALMAELKLQWERNISTL